MLLYHFTSIAYLRPDMTPGPGAPRPEGLTLGRVQMSLGPEPEIGNAQWLTTDPDAGAVGGTCVRLTVRIPSSDPRLVRWHRWARRQYGPDGLAQVLGKVPPDAAGRVARSWWLYWGAIPLDRFANIEILEGVRPWWLGA